MTVDPSLYAPTCGPHPAHITTGRLIDARRSQETDSFVCKNPKFFPTKIPILYVQLSYLCRELD
jgi:hypothetical protein